MNGFVVPIQKQIIKKIIREVPKAKCHECSKQHKSESSKVLEIRWLEYWVVLEREQHAAYQAHLD